MTCPIVSIGTVNEGQTATINYSLADEDGDPISAIDSVEYKLSDGLTTLIDWTSAPADAPNGSIVIPGSKNIVSGLGGVERYFTLHTVLNLEDTFQPNKYSILNDPNVTEDSP